MARFRDVDMQPKFIPVDFSRQILPGSFEHALHVLVDDELDLSPFAATFHNDEKGAPAYHPGVMLKIVLLGYSKGLISSRAIEAACRSHIVFMALSGDSQPHFSTIAGFVSGHARAIAKVFTEVLMVCDRQGLIGREMFAIDGVKLPANAAKARSGRREDFQREAGKIEEAVKTMLARHQSRDAQKGEPGDEADKAKRKVERLQAEARRIRQWLQDHPSDRPGTGSEQALLPGMVEAIKPVMKDDSVIAADAGYHSEGNLKDPETKGVQAFIADKQYRQRDERYRDQARHQSKSDPLWDKGAKPKKVTLFRNTDFELAGDDSHCVCPAGQRLYRNGVNCNIGGYRAMKFTGTLSGCGASRYAGARRWTASGSCIAWFTTSINSRTRGIGDERDISTDARQALCQNGCPLAPTGRMPNMRSSRLRQIETGNRRRHMMNTIADRISLIRQPL